MGASASKLLSLELPAEPASIPRARHQVAVLAGDFGARPFDVAVAVTEAVTNAILHAYEEEDPGTVRITASQEGGRLCVEVTDSGNGMTPNISRKGLGLGLPLIGSMTSDFHIESADPGVRVRMLFERRPEAPPA